MPSQSLPAARPGQQSGRDRDQGMCVRACPFLTCDSHPPLPTHPLGPGRAEGAARDPEALPRTSSCLPMPPCHLASHLSQSFLKTPGHSSSEDGHLLAHLGVPHRTCIRQGSLPRGAHNLKTQGTHTHTRRTQTQGVGHLQGTQMVRGATGWGVQHDQVCPSAVFVGEGEESRTWPRMAFGKAAASGRGLLGEEHTRGRGSRAQGEMGKSLAEGMDAGRSDKVKAGEPGKRSRGSP